MAKAYCAVFVHSAQCYCALRFLKIMTQRFSFEFYPPKTPTGRDNLLLTRNALNTLRPDFFSVTYGAGGSTRDNTKEIVLAMAADGISVAPHLSFGADDEATI